MRRIVLWFLSTVTVVVLMFGYHTSTSGAMTAASETVIPSTAVPGAGDSSGGSGGSGPGSGSGDTAGGTTGQGLDAGSGSAADAGSSSGATTVTGPVVSTQWGPVQVEVTAQAGTITDVTVLQYPDGNPMDQRINGYALPILVQETLDAQSAGIDMVSGATYTSDGYVRSLQAALDEAGL